MNVYVSEETRVDGESGGFCGGKVGATDGGHGGTSLREDVDVDRADATGAEEEDVWCHWYV